MAKKKSKTTTTPQVVEASPAADDSLDHINDLMAGSNMLYDAFTELVNTQKVASVMDILESALEKADEIQTRLRKQKENAGVKDISRYFGYYDIALPGTKSDIPSSDTEWGHKNSTDRAGKVLLRVYSRLERPLNNPFRDGGCAIILGRGTSVTQTKGNRIYQSELVPSSFLELIGSMAQEDARVTLCLLAAGYLFNFQKRVTNTESVKSTIDISGIEEIDLSALED